jgi:diguanylate cyclase (GGDEF)-like protein/PAS domain S-box-containing protein
MKLRLKPITRLSMGLVSLTFALMFVGNYLTNTVRDQSELVYGSRRLLVENLATQYSLLALRNERQVLQVAIRSLIERNTEILSAGLRRVDGYLIIETPGHSKSWHPPSPDHSTPEYMQVPILTDQGRWATLELHFAPSGAERLRFWELPWVQFLAFMAVAGLLGNLLYLRRMLAYLDPSAVVPERIKAVVNALSEGIVLVDPEGRVVLANTAMATLTQQLDLDVVGRPLSRLPIVVGSGRAEPPWAETLRGAEAESSVPVSLPLPTGTVRKLLVNTAPIRGNDQTLRGVLVSFSDVTLLEEFNAHLIAVAQEKEAAHAEIHRKNAELFRLATRDPMTGCLNRRAFFEAAGPVFAQARQWGTDLCCIMTDIDHFKTFNDVYGHAVGDRVIEAVAQSNGAILRADDLFCRYGGEEFCILLPGVSMAEAMVVAERLRADIETKAGAMVEGEANVRITSSFGVSRLHVGAGDLTALIHEADQALYVSKRGGRNRVTAWSIGFDTAPSEPLSVGCRNTLRASDLR